MYLNLFLILFQIALAFSQHSQVLVVSFDGFRYNYFDKHITPTLDRLKLKGTHAEFLRNVFITKTYPNHHSIATGLYPESHGVVANSFYDPTLKRILKYSEEMWHYRDDITPIWILNEKAGEGRHSGTFMWPGSDFAYQNTKPTFSVVYNTSIKWRDRVDTVVSWFQDSATPANLVMMYFEEPDKEAHRFGADSEAVSKQIARVDEITSYLLQQLLENNLPVNVILLSDHGMTTVTSERIINVLHMVDNSTLVAGVTPALQLIPPADRVWTVYRLLAEHSSHYNYTVYLKKDLLDRWHFKNNERVPPIFLLADEGYGFDDLLAFDIFEDVDIAAENRTYGAHGYDNAVSSMHPFFIAWGPRIKKNYTIEPFDTVDLYSLFCKLLDLDVPQTDGSLSNVVGMLTEGQTRTVSSLPIKIFAVVAVSLLLMGCACCITHQILKQDRTPASLQSYKLLDPPRIIRPKSSGNEQEERHLLGNDDIEES
ncbi:ectonucleotide pyrophosphatase/phosphodiesterase family member 5 [Anabrus simplex]|uniref:ectonucleotide pyrophosphatase/phosphodiesterase family member 5 n=1 Tax=Anabrus simplex TaxID=316456 RepID=UPI0035A39A15